MAETGDRAGHIAQHHKFRAGGARLAEHQVDRNTAGRHRLAQRLAKVDRPGTGSASSRRQPGGKHAGQRCHHPSHLPQLVTGGPQKLDVLGQLRDAVHLHMVAAQLFGGTALGLTLHHPAQLRDLLRSKSFGNLLLSG